MLKFITEDFLRKKFQKEPFKSFEIKENERLTPGGHQYLTDKRIPVIKFEEKQQQLEEKFTPPTSKNNVNKKVLYRLKYIEHFYSIMIINNIEKNIKLAQKMLDICKKLSELRKNYELGNLNEELEYKEKNQILDEEIPSIYIHSKIGVELYQLKALLYDILNLKEIIFDEINVNNELLVGLENIEEDIEKIIQELLGG
jgi:ethanolamine utilization cobalamin adenosyltransferase